MGRTLIGKFAIYATGCYKNASLNFPDAMRSLVILLVLAAYCGPGWAQTGKSGFVSATLSMETSSALELMYEVPAGCSSLTFSNAGIGASAATAIRSTWISLDECGEVSANELHIKGACTSARFRVPVDMRDFDRVYPWAFPLDAGVYAHTSAYAVQTSCGPVNWHFAAPNGTVVVDGVPSGARADRPSQQGSVDYAPVIFLQKPLQQGRSANVYIDSRFSDEARTFLTDAMRQVNNIYSSAMPGLTPPKAFIVAVPTIGGKHWRGDVANRTTMRLMVPAFPSAQEQSQLREFVAHEVAHFLQPAVLNDRWKSEQTLIKEGGAEFLAWLLSGRLGWVGPTALATRADSALNSCLLSVGDAVWNQSAQRHWGKVPYNCGLAFHLIGLGGALGRPPVETAIRDYYRDAASGDVTDFAHALECGVAKTCAAKWLPRLMNSERTVADVVAEFSATSGLLQPVERWTPLQTELVARSVMGKLMAADCKGQISIYTEPGRARIGPIGHCKTLREGMIIVKAVGKPLFDDPTATVAVFKQCKDNGRTLLALESGEEISMPCDSTLGSLPVLYRFDEARLLERMRPAPTVSVN